MLDKQMKLRTNNRELAMFRYVSKHLQMTLTATVKTLILEKYRLIKAEQKNQDQTRHSLIKCNRLGHNTRRRRQTAVSIGDSYATKLL